MRINLAIMLAVASMYEIVEFTDMHGKPSMAFAGETEYPNVIGGMKDARNAFAFVGREHVGRPNPRAGNPVVPHLILDLKSRLELGLAGWLEIGSASNHRTHDIRRTAYHRLHGKRDFVDYTGTLLLS